MGKEKFIFYHSKAKQNNYKKILRFMTKDLGIFLYFSGYLGICFYVVSIFRYFTHSKEWLKLNIKITIPNIVQYMEQLRLFPTLLESV